MVGPGDMPGAGGPAGGSGQRGRVPDVVERVVPGGPVPAGGGNGLAVAGLVLGITSIVFFWLGVFALAQVVLAVVFSGTGLRRSWEGAGRRGLAVAGLACGIGGFLAYVLFGIATLGVGLLI